MTVQLGAQPGASRGHTHITRDIKPRGDCPGCDDYHDRQHIAEIREHLDQARASLGLGATCSGAATLVADIEWLLDHR